MTDLLAARSQMALSLGFHIIFAAVGIGMPLFTILAEWRYHKTKNEIYLQLARNWARGTAILFAVGAVSGTVLSFELGLLWPTFMRYAGPIIGMPFSLEGFAFFAEAIFIGIYLYGWNKLSARMHLLAGAIVAISGVLSGMFVVTVNAWMNTPAGFEMVNGRPMHVEPFTAMFNPAWLHEVLHSTLASYMATAFAVAATHAFLLLRKKDQEFHRKALSISLKVAIFTALLQPLSGDISARFVGEHQPTKLAALEGQFNTERNAPLRIGGIPNEQTGETPYAIELPSMLSFLAYHDVNAEVKGLADIPRENWPPVLITHVAFQVMVASGTVLALLSVWIMLSWYRKRSLEKALEQSSKLLLMIAITGPLGFIALESGWTVTEVGRQPWVIYNFMRTADAVTPMPGLVVPFLLFTAVYIILAAVTVVVLRKQFFRAPQLAITGNPTKEAVHAY